MGLLSKLLIKKSIDLHELNGECKTSGELIAEATDGANLVDGHQTWVSAEFKKDDLDHMKKCCNAELETMQKAGLVAAPFYFERVAILSRKAKNYRDEVYYCEKYISAVETYYRLNGARGVADVRKGPRFQAIAKRLPKAKALLARVL